MVSRNPFAGVWTRDYLCFDAGAKNTRQQVLWIQAEQFFADVRTVHLEDVLTPARYEQVGWREGFTTYTGFTGQFCWSTTSDSTTMCTWMQDIGIFPAEEDEVGECRWIGPHQFIETGAYADDQGRLHTYEQQWTRISSTFIDIYEFKHGLDRARCLIAGNWAIIIHEWRKPETCVFRNPEAFSSFSATAWQRQNNRWRMCFSTAPVLGQTSPWTPEKIIISHHWQRQVDRPIEDEWQFMRDISLDVLNPLTQS